MRPDLVYASPSLSEAISALTIVSLTLVAISDPEPSLTTVMDGLEHLVAEILRTTRRKPIRRCATNTSAESFSDAVSKLVGDSGSGRDRPRDARPLNRLAWQATADTNGEATPFMPERLVNWLRVLWPFLTA